jgi:hypothetical protein
VTKLKVAFNEDKSVRQLLSDYALMDVFSKEKEKLLFTIEVIGAQLYKGSDFNEKVDRFCVYQEPNSIHYVLDKGTLPTYDSKDGSISFLSGDRKYIIRSEEDSDGFAERSN